MARTWLPATLLLAVLSAFARCSTHCTLNGREPKVLTAPVGRVADGSGEWESYLPGSNCTWHVRPAGDFQSVTLVFEKFKVATNRDYLFVRTRAFGEEEALSLYTGMLPTPMAVRVEAPSIELQFLSGTGHAMDDGFDVLYLAGDQCYKNCRGAPGARCVRGLCECPRGHYGADCSIHASELVPGQKISDQVGTGERENIKYYQVEVPDGQKMKMLVELEVLQSEGFIRPTLLLGNATNASGDDPNFYQYKMQRAGECGEYPGCWWSPEGLAGSRMRTSSSNRLSTNDPTADFEMAGTTLLDRYAPFPHATTRISALPTYTFFSLKDYESSTTHRGHHSVHLGREDNRVAGSALPQLTPGTWIVGVLNAPNVYSGMTGAMQPFDFELIVQLEEAHEPICSFNCSSQGTCPSTEDNASFLIACDCSMGEDDHLFLGESCRDVATLLDIDDALIPEPLPIGGWAYFYIDVPEDAPVNQSIAIEIAYSSSPLAVPHIYVTKERDGLPSPEVICKEVQGSGPYDTLSCDIGGYGPVLSYSRDGVFGPQLDYSSMMIYPEYRFYDEEGRREPVERFYIAVQNHHSLSQEKLQYAIMVSWLDSNAQPCPFKCGNHGQCGEDGKCTCRSDAAQAWVGDYCQNTAPMLHLNVPKHEVLGLGHWHYYTLDILATTAVVLELIKQEEEAFPYLFVSAKGIPKLSASGQLVNEEDIQVLHDDSSYFCAGTECFTQFVHRLAFRATPGRYFVSIHNGAFAARHTTPLQTSVHSSGSEADRKFMTYSLIARVSDSSSQIPCYGACSGHGTCGEDAPSCTCDENFFGPDCAIEPQRLSLAMWPANVRQTGTVNGGHFDYFYVDVPEETASLVVEFSQPFFDNAEGLLLLAKDRLPIWCSPASACQREYDIISHPVHGEQRTLHRVVVKEGIVASSYYAGQRVSSNEIVPAGRWYIALHNRAFGVQKLHYTLYLHAKQELVACADPTCSGHGICDTQSGQCDCEDGFLLDDCSVAVVEVGNNSTIRTKEDLYPQKALYYSIPVTCAGHLLEAQVFDPSGRPFDGTTIYHKRAELPWIGDSASFDHAEAGARALLVSNLRPGIHFIEVYVRENALRPLPAGSTIDISLKPSGKRSEHNECEFDTGTYYLKAMGSSNSYKVLNPGSNELVEEEGPFMWSYDYNTRTGNIQDGPIGEVDYGQCGAMQDGGRSCYFWKGRDQTFAEPAYGPVEGNVRVGLSQATSGASPYHYLAGHMHKFHGTFASTNYSQAYSGMYKDFPLLYEYNLDDEPEDPPIDFLGCTPLLNAEDMKGSICLVARGGCTFSTKTRNCEDAGAIAAIIVNADTHNAWSLLNVVAGAGIDPSQINIPTLTTGVYVGNKILAMLGSNDLKAPYEDRVTVSMGQYVCEDAGPCTECAYGHFGEMCELACPGLDSHFTEVCSGQGECVLDSEEEEPQCQCAGSYTGHGCERALQPPQFVEFPMDVVHVAASQVTEIPLKTVSESGDAVQLALVGLPEEMEQYISLDEASQTIHVSAPEVDAMEIVRLIVTATDSANQSTSNFLDVVFVPGSPEEEGTEDGTENPQVQLPARLDEPNEDANSGGSGLSGGQIAGIVIGCIAAAAIAGAMMFLLVAKKRNVAALQHIEDQSIPTSVQDP